MESIAVWIGYGVMVAGGIALAVTLLFLAASFAWSIWSKGLNGLDVVDACKEWRVNHPEKFKRWQKRNAD